MRMFRSMRNPVTKTGRTSNTTGSRIRTSARTIREQTGNLVQNARKKISTPSPVKRAIGAAKAVATSPIEYNRGRKLATAGRNTTGSYMNSYQNAYKNDIADNKLLYKRLHEVGISHELPKIIRETKATRGYASNAAPVEPISGSKAFKLGYRNSATKIQSRIRKSVPDWSAKQETRGTEKGSGEQASRVRQGVLNRLRAGAKSGYRMPDASVRQAYNAQRFSASASFPGHTPVALASRGMAGSFAAGYGVGKLAKRAVQAPVKAYGAGQKVTFGIQDALKGVGRGFKYAAQGNLQTAKYATMNAANAAYRGESMADRLASRIVNPIERGMQRLAPAATRIGKLNARVVEAAVPGFTSNPLAATARRIAQPVRYAQRKANERSARIAAEAARQQRIQKATPWGPKGSVTPTGKNAVVMQQRYQAAVLGNSASNMGVMGPPRPSKFYRQQAKPSATPAAQPQTKTPWGGRSVNWASYQPQAATPPVTPPAQPRGTGKKRGPRMPSAGQYRSGITPGQTHPLRNKGAAPSSPPASATPPLNPVPPKKTPKDVLAEVQPKIRGTAASILKHEDRWNTTKGFEGFAAQQRSELKMLIDVARRAQKDMRPADAEQIAKAGASRTAQLVRIIRANADPDEQMRDSAGNLVKRGDRVRTTSVDAGSINEWRVNRIVTTPKGDRISVKGAGGKRTSFGVDEISSTKDRLIKLNQKAPTKLLPTTGDQPSLFTEEPQKRKQGGRGKDKQKRKQKGQAGN